MALYRYFRPADGVLDSKGPLSGTIAPSVLAEVKKEVNSVAGVQKKKRGLYLFFTPEEKARAAQYAGIYGVRAAVRRFSTELGKELKENTVRDWVKRYQTELHNKRRSAEPGCEVVVSQLTGKRRGRPLLLGETIDAEIQTIIKAMRDNGAVVNTSIAIAIAIGVVRKRDRSLLKEEGGPLELTKNWAKSILQRMGFVKRRGNTKAKVAVEQFEALKTQYLFDIKATVEMMEIPPELVINWDQTGIKIVPVSSWTMEKKGTRRVEIAGVDDKRQITATFAATAVGDFLPVQLIYQGKTSASLPAFTFPDDWCVTYTPNRWANEQTTKAYIEDIILPYVNEKRRQLHLEDDHPALVIFDVFKGQCTEEILKVLEDNHIEHVLVPPNCTDRLQPLDLSVNKPAKEFLRRKFQEWFANQIADQLESDDTQQVDMRLSIMKPLGARWLVELYDYLGSNPSFIVNGFAAAGILDALKD